MDIDSEVFENYYKIALEQGLITKEAYPNNEEQIKKNESGKDDLSEFEILYGVKPNGKDDEKSIIEKAHPDTVVISPAQDRFNGVIENLQERHNIMTYIANKHPSNTNPNKVYVKAKDDLMKSIIRIGFDMDNQEQDDLMKLADSCADRLCKKAGPLAIIGITAAVLLPYIYGVYNSRLIDQGVMNSIKNAKEELEEARDNIPSSTGSIDNALKIINYFETYAIKFFNLQKPDVGSVADIAKLAQSNIDDIAIYADYKKACMHMLEVLPTLITEFEALASSQNESNWGRFFAPIKSLYEFFVPDDVHDAANALKTLQVSIANSLKVVNAIEQRAKAKANSEDFIKKFEEAQKQQMKQTKEQTEQTTTPSEQTNQNNVQDDYEQQIMNIPVS